MIVAIVAGQMEFPTVVCVMDINKGLGAPARICTVSKKISLKRIV